MDDQQKVWDNIAEEWGDFRKEPIEEIISFLKKQKGKILDLGSGSGRNLIKLKNSKLYEIDFSKKMLELGEQKAKRNKINAEFIQASADNLPFEDEFFDAALYVAALHCLETETKRKQSVKELFRVLKRGAQAYISVWNVKSFFANGKKEKMINWREKGTRYYYFYSEEEVHNLFEKIGFKTIFKEEKKGMINFIVEKPKQ